MTAMTKLTVVDTPSREVRKTGLWINIIGHHHGDASYQLQERVTVDAVLILTVAGQGWYRTPMRSGRVRAGDLLVLPAHTSHGYGSAGSGRAAWELLWAHVAGPRFEQLLTLWPAGQQAVPCPLGESRRLLVAALAEVSQRRDGYGLVAAGHVEQVIRSGIAAARRQRAPDERHAHNYVTAMQNYIHAHLDERLTLRTVADHVHLDPSYACRIFKSATGYSPVEYAIKSRLDLAKSLLQSSRTPVAAIARQLGYTDPSYFARVFRATTGLNPRAYRDTVRFP